MKAERNKRFALRFGLISSVCCLRVAMAGVDLSRLPPPAAIQVDFARDIKPILETSCLRCHGRQKAKSDFRLDNRRSALKGGDDGVDILPGNSAKSPLIHYVAYLVDDMKMPPPGKGKQLDAGQIALLRAWIDQGAAWDAPPANNDAFSITPIFGGTTVSGDSHKFQEHYWQKAGLNGGMEEFEYFKQTDPDTQVLLTGHALVDDYKINLSVDREQVGFIHAGWEEYRKYFDDTGGFFPAFSPTAPSLGQDLFLDIGRAWIDFGLNLPHWPRMVLGYEYDYKEGDEAITDWGAFQQPGGRGSVNILPASENIHEGLSAIKFDLDDEIKGVTIEDRFRGEFYGLDTGRNSITPTGISGGSTNVTAFYSENAGQTTRYFQGANTLRLEKQFTDWFLGSAGYLYSRLNSDDSFSRNITPQTVLVGATPLSLQLLVPQITLARQSQVVNANGILGPFDGLVISTGVQSEWTHEEGFGNGALNSIAPTVFSDPVVLNSDYDQTSVMETLAVRYSKIPYTVLFAEARLEQQTIGQSGEFNLDNPFDTDNTDRSDFLQQTDFSSQLTDLRFGLNTSPWQSVLFSLQYRRYDDDSHYDNAQLQQPVGVPASGYPGFITARNLLTDEVEAKLALRPCAWFKTTLSYQLQTTDYRTDTAAAPPFTPGGELLAGRENFQVFSINAVFTPTRRLYLSSTFSYQPTTTVTADSYAPAVAPYRGAIYSAFANGTYVLSETTDLTANYSFSAANYGDNLGTTSVPLGIITYQQHALQLAVVRRFGKNVSTRLQYAIDYYREPSSGGADNYCAQSIFGALTFQFR